MTEHAGGQSADKPQMSMRRRIKRFEPIQLGKMLGFVYGVMSLIIVPFFLLYALFSDGSRNVPGAGFGLVFILFIPFIYALIGFIGGIIAAFVYNFCAGIIGGIDVDVETGLEVSE
jgi:hypothetical protein